jgi:hypothetical protein
MMLNHLDNFRYTFYMYYIFRFFHGPIKRSAAERTLLVFKEGSYLVRRSETSKKDFSLTLKYVLLLEVVYV